MDFSLRCNSLKCRAKLDDRAVVTTCSHIFCVPCSESLGLANPSSDGRHCPACQTQLNNLDDAVVTQLNPAEDYKTSVLSGLSPTIIMECAGRAMSFFSYQTAQEIIYQEFLARSLTDKYSALSLQMDKIIHDANSEITSLREKLEAMHVDQKALEQKNHDLAERYKDKSKQQQSLQRLYNDLKQQQNAAGLELAAEHQAEHTLRAAGLVQNPQRHQRGGQPMQSRGSNGSNGSGGQSRTIQAWEQQNTGSRMGLQTARSAPVGGVPTTPSGHRQRLNIANPGTTSKQYVGGQETTRRETTYRHPLGNMEPNIYGHINPAGYGMSAGAKMGRQPGGSVSRQGMPMPGPISRATGLGGHHGREY
ncbi:hypothetical protein LTR56_005681 [Elasticomyces elasticus]|nr:hypothetical protein LTR56_005681 [Elasticomyces elasticus]KAK3663932.1 hypothetical protein LTR22_005152 [Elasticomyces elasticus]KAK4927422.1 hypothetical protein LTR49_005827 [Elasticomyces elasticus]KAK5763386.1 hypothetical protein LTS12_006561 [Elasticomyces elasticus]